MSEVIQLGHNFINFSGNFTSINHTAQLVISLLIIWLGEGCYQLLSTSYCHPTLIRVKVKFTPSFTVPLFLISTHWLSFLLFIKCFSSPKPIRKVNRVREMDMFCLQFRLYRKYVSLANNWTPSVFTNSESRVPPSIQQVCC